MPSDLLYHCLPGGMFILFCTAPLKPAFLSAAFLHFISLRKWRSGVEACGWPLPCRSHPHWGGWGAGDMSPLVRACAAFCRKRPEPPGCLSLRQVCRSLLALRTWTGDADSDCISNAPTPPSKSEIQTCSDLLMLLVFVLFILSLPPSLSLFIYWKLMVFKAYAAIWGAVVLFGVDRGVMFQCLVVLVEFFWGRVIFTGFLTVWYLFILYSFLVC